MNNHNLRFHRIIKTNIMTILSYSELCVCIAVVWNPWSEKAKGMSDFGDEEYKTMVCVEAGSVVDPVTLGAGEKTSFSQKITVKSKM